MISAPWRSLALLALFCAPAIAEAPSPRFVIDCGSLRGQGAVAFEIGDHRFVTQFACHQQI